MGTVEFDTIIRVGDWQRATTRQSSEPGYEIAPVIDGTTTIGHLRRFADGNYQAVLGDTEQNEAATVRCTSEFAGLITVARHCHKI